ncbi:MAG: undecaprenyldiphospho-muramoylpentapeptide beta-N-acetylglucosaminyltransferase [Gammaproteobacteria bacterium]|nr:undecaprenyldiphospho-muramoylpentapeptide beta-N-acetylglucosaminyltransferase [Gammaproteobacteria bacterium]
MTVNKKVLIMAGGTGGHIFPALGIAKQLQSLGVEVEWLGTKKGMESELIPQTSIPIHYISVSGLRGKSAITKVFAPFVILIGIIQAIGKILKTKPSCVLGMGGFVTGPGGVAAWLLRKPLVIHEQNAIAGFSNQMLYPMASIVLEGFDGAFKRKQDLTKSSLLKRFGKGDKAVHVGNPLRQEILDCPSPSERYADNEENSKGKDRIKLLVLGGSRGALAINRIVPELLKNFSAAGNVDLWHQCGKQNLLSCEAYYKELGIDENPNYRIAAFIDDMAEAYSWADVVICRAGASTVAEIAAIGIPAVFIPFPYAVDDHQTENAIIMQKLGAAWLIQQKELSVEGLGSVLLQFIDDKNLILKTALLAQKAAKTDATEQAAKYCMEACYG